MTEATPVVTRWWWIRHAPVTCYSGRFYGNMDLPADCSDPALFRGLASALPNDAVWVTSHLRRTLQTAEAIAAAGATTAPPLVEPDLAEQSFGDWQGRTHEEVHDMRDGAWHRFWLAPAHERPPGGESFVELADRVGRTIDRLTREHAGRDIVAVTHGGTIRAAMSHVSGLSAERSLAISIANCSLTQLDHIAGALGSHQTDGEPTDGVWRVNHVNLPPVWPSG